MIATPRIPYQRRAFDLPFTQYLLVIIPAVGSAIYVDSELAPVTLYRSGADRLEVVGNSDAVSRLP